MPWHEEYECLLPESSPDYQRAVLAFCHYYVMTEQNDRRFPGAWSKYDSECWLPYDPQANAFARDELARTKLKLAGIARDIVQQAMYDACSLRYTKQLEMLNVERTKNADGPPAG